ncbi:beta-1,3-glucanase family protein [Kutzneria albida]|uniref:Glycosyl hydrolase (Secreted protein) n=1 Tax=Kutzneria albida DSM 43870 TaxID=1449976 RepID=W5W7I9_9PSEU|nr:beta-1,3-glucanase family protein [Kutzneria albida]AHH96902.1 glycosyl hydrolase (secreted protein) [Kutzneria albida DSM 43870]
MISRRALLGGAAALAVAAPAGAAIATWTTGATAAPAPAGLRLRVVNKTGVHANNALSMYVVGTDLASGNQAFVRGDGTLSAVSLSDNGPGGFADLSIPFPASGDAELTLPRMSGRVYFSANDKLRFTVVADGAGKPALRFPAGWVRTDPSFGVLHDWVEFTFNEAGMFCNTTMVDMFSMPLAIRLDGQRSQTTGTLVPGGRARVLSALAADPVFGKLVVDGGQRVIAPGHGIEAGLFPADFLDSHIQQVWTRYQSTDLVVTTDRGRFTGRVAGEVLTFSGGVAPIRKPSTKDVLFCDGALAARNDGVTGPVAAVLGAALNRTTLLDTSAQPATDPQRFYRAATTNLYSKVMHANSVDGRAYGFAFDDVAGFAAFVQDPAPTAMTITLTPF